MNGGTPPTMLPVGMVLPTRNCVELLRHHLPQLKPFVHLLAQIVVVDSESNDGTWELLRSEIQHPRAQFHRVPPGLYEAWNFGISQISSEWTHICTAGDVTREEGLRKLTHAGQQTAADVVVSPPVFVTETGAVREDKTWPIHRLLKRSSPTGSAALDSVCAFVVSTLDAPQGILGSSAANLYRTRTLRARPFPSDFGHFGDTAWAIQHALDLKFALVPDRISTFLLHESGATQPAPQIEALRTNLHQLAIDTLSSRQAEPGTAVLLEKIRRFVKAHASLRDAQEAYSSARRAHGVWILRPGVWKARTLRNQFKAEVEQLRADLQANYEPFKRTAGGA